MIKRTSIVNLVNISYTNKIEEVIKKHVLSVFFLFFSFNIYTQNVLFEWASSMDEGVITNSNVTDVSGNIYETGQFFGTIDFDPGSAVFNLSTNGGMDIFIRKLDANGKFVWARSFGSTMVDRGSSIVVDVSNDILLTGVFTGIVDFDPGSAVFNLIPYSFNSSDVFILKLNAAGNFIWAKSVGGIAEDKSNGISTDASGNVYVTGTYLDSADFDPGTAEKYLVSKGKIDAFIVKLDDNGGFVWTGSIGGPSEDQCNSITTDASGNVYLTGFYEGTADFDPGSALFNMSSAGLKDIFVLKLNSNGSFEWAKSMGGTSGEEGLSITTDQSGNACLTGYFEGTVDFDPGAVINNLVSKGLFDFFIQKFTSNGTLLWTKTLGGTFQDNGVSICTDVFDNYYITGSFTDSVDFDPGQNDINLTSIGAADVFILKLDSDGNYEWVSVYGGISYDFGRFISISADGNIHTSGSFNGTVDFDPTADTFFLSSPSGLATRTYIQKLSQPFVGIQESKLFNPVSIYPNPNYGHVSIQFGDGFTEASICIKDLNGQIKYAQKNIVEKLYKFEFQAAAGLYIVELLSEGRTHQFKLIKM